MNDDSPSGASSPRSRADIAATDSKTKPAADLSHVGSPVRALSQDNCRPGTSRQDNECAERPAVESTRLLGDSVGNDAVINLSGRRTSGRRNLFVELPADGPSTSAAADSLDARRTHRSTASTGAAVIGDADASAPSVYANGRRQGHLRGTRSNGFASGPPFANDDGDDGVAERAKPPLSAGAQRHSTCNYYWGTTPADRQKHQQRIELIEKEINVMAQESQCGIDTWRPKWLQRFATKNWMVFLLCWFCAIQGMLINGLIPSSISTIERRFGLSTSTIGRIMQFYDFGYVLLCIPVSYFGGRHSKPTVLSVGLGLMVMGSFIFTMPHFIAEPFTNAYNSDSADLSKCYAGNATSSAVSSADFDALRACPSPENQPGNFRYVFLFSLAHFLHGLGATPLFTIGVSYIDENVGPALSSLYLGVFYAFAIFGPAFGFMASSTFLRWHTDFLQAGKRFASILSLDETDPKWVGAWYLGFLLVSVLGLLAIFPILILPKVLPESLKWHRTRLREETLNANKKRTPECCGMPSSSKTAVISGSLLQVEAHEGSVVIMPALKNRSAPIWYQLWLDVRHIPIAIYRILLNGPYMLITLGMAIDGLIVTGCSTFMSKYLERQFGVAPSKANLLIGAVMVPMAGCGTMLAGFAIHHFRMSCVRTLQFCLALLVCSLCLSPMYFIYCDHDQLVGIERHYPVDDDISNHYDNATDYYTFHLETSCNSHCECHHSEYYPVCAEFADGTQAAFYSPCYAGCQQMYSPLQKEYLNCSCAPSTTRGGYRRVKKGYCESKCRGLFAFLFFFAPFCFFTFAVGVALITVVLRTVDYDERSFALGVQWILVRIIGTIPAPVVFGWLFDVSCVRRHLDPCSGASGSCMLYHNKSLADLFFAFSLAGALVAIACLLFVLIFFASSLRDDPLPTSAVDAPAMLDDEGDIEHGEANDDEDEDVGHPSAVLHENPLDDAFIDSSPKNGTVLGNKKELLLLLDESATNAPESLINIVAAQRSSQPALI